MIFCRHKFARLVDSSFEARLLIERKRKAAKIADFDTKNGDHGGNRTHDCQDENLES